MEKRTPEVKEFQAEVKKEFQAELPFSTAGSPGHCTESKAGIPKWEQEQQESSANPAPHLLFVSHNSIQICAWQNFLISESGDGPVLPHFHLLDYKTPNKMKFYETTTHIPRNHCAEFALCFSYHIYS